MDVLIADDEKSILVPLKDDLAAAGHRVVAVEDAHKAAEMLADRHFHCVIADINMPGPGGIALLKAVKAAHPDTEVMMITGYGTIESAVEAMKLGAFDYILKPFYNEEIVQRLKKIEEYSRLREENTSLREQLSSMKGLPSLIGTSPKMQDVFKIVRTVAKGDSSVLIEGESGTGKERIAHAIHELSPRKLKPFVPISAASLPESLLEDELFGHERGAFTDARKQKIGRFERAHRGTLFLDDIDDMSLSTQVKLLRVLQERCFERLGGEETIHVDIRVIAATKIALEKLVREGRFREDLFYRLNVVPVRLPPLREREGDIPLLVAHFVRQFSKDKGTEYQIKPQVMEALCRHSWPGNVRELENAVERAIALAGNATFLRREHLLRTPSSGEAFPFPADADLRTLEAVVEESERVHIRRVLRSTQGQKARAAKVLGISRKNLWEKMKQYGLEPLSDEPEE